MRSSGEHVGYSRDGIGRFGLVIGEILGPLHGGFVFAHGGLTDSGGIAGHAGKSVGARTQDGHFAQKIHFGDSGVLGDVRRSSRESARDLGLHQLRGSHSRFLRGVIPRSRPRANSGERERRKDYGENAKLSLSMEHNTPR